MTYQVPPLRIPAARSLVRPMTRPFNIDRSCVLCLMPEINTKWVDYSGYGNTGTRVDTVLNDKGRYGPCLEFDDTARYVEMADSVSLRLTTTASWELWCYPHNIVGGFGLFDKYSTVGANRSYRISFYDRKITMAISTNGTDAEAEVTDAFLVLNKWHHIVITFDNGDWQVYDNGSAVGMVFDFTLTSILPGVIVTKLGVWGADYFDGLIDEVRIYNRALASWEVKALYELGKPS